MFTVPKGDINPEDFELEIIDAGVEDIELSEDVFEITCAVEDFGKVQKKLDEMGVKIENAQLQRIPNDTKKLDLDAAQKVLKIIEEFEDVDDVQYVYHNLEMTDELMNGYGVAMERSLAISHWLLAVGLQINSRRGACRRALSPSGGIAA